jgi:beta-lactam-binding protein with PASTA domain
MESHVVARPRSFVTEVAVEAVGGTTAAIIVGWLGQIPALIGLVFGAVLASVLEPRAAAVLHHLSRDRPRIAVKAPSARELGRHGWRPSRWWALVTGTAVILVVVVVTAIDVTRGTSLLGDRRTTFIPPQALGYVEVPNVRGASVDDARARLVARGFVVSRGPLRFDQEIPRGAVAGSKPAAGQAVEKRSRVEIVVSLGKGVEVPNVESLSFDAASAQLGAQGFVVTRAPDRFDDEVPRGFVVGTDPSAGVTVAHGSKVQLAVSLGKGIEVPDVRGASLDDASAELRASGFAVARGADQLDAQVPAGAVVGTEPAAGENAAQASQVQIVVSLGKGIEVPDVRGALFDSASNELSAKGFAVVRRDVPDPTLASGTIISTAPGAGDVVPEGTTVEVLVSQGPLPAPPSAAEPSPGS